MSPYTERLRSPEGWLKPIDTDVCASITKKNAWVRESPRAKNLFKKEMRGWSPRTRLYRKSVLKKSLELKVGVKKSLDTRRSRDQEVA